MQTFGIPAALPWLLLLPPFAPLYLLCPRTLRQVGRLPWLDFAVAFPVILGSCLAQ